MFATEDSWDEGDDHVKSGIVNNPLQVEDPIESTVAHYSGAIRHALVITLRGNVYTSISRR
jgi:hypothetical protein